MQIISTSLTAWGRLIENSAFNFTIAPNISQSTQTNSLSRCLINNPVCSPNNSIIYGTVWWADGRTLISVVLWLWLSAVLHYSWVVIRLIALQWKEGWTKPPLNYRLFHSHSNINTMVKWLKLLKLKYFISFNHFTIPFHIAVCIFM